MTVSSQLSKKQYNGDGVTIVFPTVFQFATNEGVKVILTDTSGVDETWVEGTQYTITGAGNPSGGNVTVETAPTDYTPLSGEILTLLRDEPYDQESKLPLGGPFPSTTVEGMADKNTFLAQQNNEKFSRALKLSETAKASEKTELPSATNRSDKLLAFDSIGDPIVSTATLAEIEAGAPGAAISAAEAAASAAAALVSENNADASEDRAQEWAENPEDDPVVPGGFSAFHWSEKAEATALTIGTLDSLSDVEVTTPNDRDVLTFDQGSNDWVPTPSFFPGMAMDFFGSSAPSGWALCNFQELSRTTESALFAVIGTTYGNGNGTTTFNVPDRRGRVSVGAGAGPSLTSRAVGDSGGEEDHQLTIAEMPSHDHIVTVPTGTVLRQSGTGTVFNSTSPVNTSFEGGDGPHNNMQPFLVSNVIIKL